MSERCLSVTEVAHWRGGATSGLLNCAARRLHPAAAGGRNSRPIDPWVAYAQGPAVGQARRSGSRLACAQWLASGVARQG